MSENIEIPYDIYESPNEIVIIMPLGGVKKDSISLKIEDYRLIIHGVRQKTQLREDFIPLREECYWGEINLAIDLPPQSYFDKIHSKISGDNILEIIVPKATVPSQIEIEIEY